MQAMGSDPATARAGEQNGSELQTLACRCRERFATDYVLALGSFPRAASPSEAPPRVEIVLVGPAGVQTRMAPYAGHPDILLARTVKEALNFFRLALMAPVGGAAEA
jgi:hypothetical protein